MRDRQSERNLLLITAIIALMAAPTGLVTGYYLFSGDPRVRPLATSRESEALGERHRLGIELVAHIRWGRDSQTAYSQSALTNMITQAFYAHGEDSRVELQEVSGQSVSVTYQIGHNSIGPMPVHEAASGIRAAISAYRRMVN